jgi:hypothetical protein
VAQQPAILAGLPEAIAVPGETVVVTLLAQGAQIYECKAGDNGQLGWAAREPIAALLQDGKTVGRHYVGPNWEHIDGSAVVGKLSARAPAPSANDIPWLKLDVTEHRGKGLLSGVTTILRINTQGGVAPSGACDKPGALASVAYSTDYVFLRKP